MGVTPPLTGEPTLTRVPELFLAALSRPSANYCGLGSTGPGGLAEAVRWVATVWPSNREPFYAKGASDLGNNVDWWEAHWETRHFLEPLLLPTEPVREMGRLLVALGLGAKESGERTLATDVLVATLQDGRLDPADIGGTLARLYAGQVIGATRLATPLEQVGGVSPRHREAVATIIEYLLANLTESPRADMYALLATLADVLASLGRELSLPAARGNISRINGSGKAARLAKSLVRWRPLSQWPRGSQSPPSTTS